MKCWVFIIGISFLLGSCGGASTKESRPSERAPVPMNSRQVKVELADSLALLTFSVPVTYDTFFSWVMRSDCGLPCEEQAYRFQPKSLRIFKESGFFWIGEPRDTVEQLTITHSRALRFGMTDTSKRFMGRLNIALEQDPFYRPIIFDTIEKIGDRYFSIVAIEKLDSIRMRKVTAETYINQNKIEIEYSLLTQKNDSLSKNFIRNSIDLIRTMRIESKDFWSIDTFYARLGIGRPVYKEDVSGKFGESDYISSSKGDFFLWGLQKIPVKSKLDPRSMEVYKVRAKDSYFVVVAKAASVSGVDRQLTYLIVSKLGKDGRIERTDEIESRFANINCLVEVGDKRELGYYKVVNGEGARFVLTVNSVEGDRQLVEGQVKFMPRGNDRVESFMNDLRGHEGHWW